MKKYKITYKEVGRPTPRTTYYSGDKSEEYVIKFFGLETDPKVEWYDIQLTN